MVIFSGGAIRWALIAPFLIFYSFILFSEELEERDAALGSLNFLWLIILFFIAFHWFWARWTYRFYRYELRENGFYKEHGVVWKKYVTIPYDRIQNIDIYRGLLARLLGLSDMQIQTAGGITMGSYGSFAEGRLPGLAPEVAEQLRDELLQRAKSAKTSQGL